MQYYVGIDIGSTCAKTIVLDAQKNILHRLLQPTGWSSVETAEQIYQTLQALHIANDMCCVATGYGRVSVPFADRRVTEITCHGKGAGFLYGQDALSVIDIGGQDTKIIRVERGAVQDFIMNDKCAAGTGRFLEIMANLLGLTPDGLCRLAAEGGGTVISSLCTVFAQSEVTSLIGQGTSKADIAFAVVESIVTKVTAQIRKLRQNTGSICLTGGLCQCTYLCQRLSHALEQEVVTSPDGRYAGAIGAALEASVCIQ